MSEKNLNKKFFSKRFFRSFAPFAIVIVVILSVVISLITFDLLAVNNNPGNEDVNQYEDVSQYRNDISFKSIDNKTINLIDHEGKIIILHFFILGCSVCKQQAGALVRIENEYASDQLLILSITVHYWDTNEDLTNWKNDFYPDWDIVRENSSYTLATAFNIAIIPTTIILDQNGSLVKRIAGYDPGNFEIMKERIDELLQN